MKHITRRHLLQNVPLFATAAALAACDTVPTIPVLVGVTLPPAIQAIVDDANLVIGKVKSLGINTGNIGSLIAQAEAEVAKLVSGVQGLDTKTIVSTIVSVLGSVASLLPPPYGTIALAIETLLPIIGGFLGLRTARTAPTGMSPAQARAILR